MSACRSVRFPFSEDIEKCHHPYWRAALAIRQIHDGEAIVALLVLRWKHPLNFMRYWLHVLPVLAVSFQRALERDWRRPRNQQDRSVKRVQKGVPTEEWLMLVNRKAAPDVCADKKAYSGWLAWARCAFYQASWFLHTPVIPPSLQVLWNHLNF